MKQSWTAIWTEIAETFDTPKAKKNDRQKRIATHGLCYGLLTCGIRGHIINKVMSIARECDIPISLSPYWWPRTEKRDRYRATFAGLMAAMGDEGFESFLKWCGKHQ